MTNFLWYKKGTSIAEAESGLMKTQKDFESVFKKYDSEMRYVFTRNTSYLIITPIADGKYNISQADEDLIENDWYDVYFETGENTSSADLSYEQMLEVFMHYVNEPRFLSDFHDDYEWFEVSPIIEILAELLPFESDSKITNEGASMAN